MNTTELRALAESSVNEAQSKGWYSVVTLEKNYDIFVADAEFMAVVSPAQVIAMLDEIDRLTRETVASDIRIGNDAKTIAELQREKDTCGSGAGCLHKVALIESLDAERDALKSSNESYITLANTAYEVTEQRTAERDALIAERDAALAKLAALAAQEPVAVFDVLVRDGVAAIRIAESAFFARLKSGDKLYAAAGAAPVPEGWQLVPVEPTEAMLNAADHGRWQGGLECQYRNMLAAAPKDES